MRLALLRMGEAEHQLVWTHHHLVLDGWSLLAALPRRAGALRGVRARGAAPRLGAGAPVPGLRGVAGAAGPRRGRSATGGERWRASAPPRRCRWRAAAATGRAGHGAAESCGWTRTHRALQEQARRWGVTMSTLVQGAWALLLARYAGEEDVVFGATVSGRPAELAGVEETVGLFINTLPVRVRLGAEATLGEWLQGLQREQVETREYEYAPLVRGAEVERGAGRGGAVREPGGLRELPGRPGAGEAGSPGGLRVRSATWASSRPATRSCCRRCRAPS